MFIIMLGGPGSGKGSVGGRLAEDLNLVHISTGDIFREEIKNQTELGLKMQEYIKNGQLVPDDIVLGIVGNRLLADDVKNGAILDGFPRTANQAKALDEFLKSSNRQIKVAIELDVVDDDIVKRIVNRVMCSNKKCGEIYNTVFKPTKEPNKCDKCGSELVKRADDNEETVRKRLEVYHKESKDILKYYKDKGLLYTIHPDIYSETVLEDNVKEAEEYLKK